MVSQMLHIPSGVVAVMGSGGKTTLLSVLAQELSRSVILCTTTHMFPFPQYPLLPGDDAGEIQAALSRHRVVCLGRPNGDGKLTAPALPFAQLRGLAPWVLVEADGSKRLPLKAHAPHEPVIPPESGQTILVVGASGFGVPIHQTVHRPERFCALTGAAPEDRVTPELAAWAIVREGLAGQVFLNQVESQADWIQAERFAQALAETGMEVWAGSLRQGICRRLTSSKASRANRQQK